MPIKTSIFPDLSSSKIVFNVPYGATMLVEDNVKIKAQTTIFQWDPYTDIILARETGIVKLKDFVEGETYAVEAVEGGKKQMVVVEARDRKLSPHIEITDKSGKILAC